MLTEAQKQDIIDAGIAADRLRTDPAFQRAIVQMRKDATEALIGLREGDDNYMAENRRLRAEIVAIDSLCGQIASAIKRAEQLTRTPAAVA